MTKEIEPAELTLFELLKTFHDRKAILTHDLYGLLYFDYNTVPAHHKDGGKKYFALTSEKMHETIEFQPLYHVVIYEDSKFIYNKLRFNYPDEKNMVCLYNTNQYPNELELKGKQQHYEEKAYIHVYIPYEF